MRLLEKIVNYFQQIKPKTITVTAPLQPGGIIPVKSIYDQIVILPCPPIIQQADVCICASCDVVSLPCPMERLCQSCGCEKAFIKGCTNYKNEKNNDEGKKRVFKNGTSFNEIIFFFHNRRSEKDNGI